MGDERPSDATMARVLAEHGFPAVEPPDFAKARALEETLLLLVGASELRGSGPAHGGARDIARSALGLIGQALNAIENQPPGSRRG